MSVRRFNRINKIEDRVGLYRKPIEIWIESENGYKVTLNGSERIEPFFISNENLKQIRIQVGK